MALAWALPAIWGILWIANGLLPEAALSKVLWNWLIPTLLCTLAGAMIVFVGVIALLFSKREHPVAHTRSDT